MVETSMSLLNALQVDPDTEAWQRLVDFYTPLIRGWLMRHGMSGADADDVVQEVLTVVFRRIAEFERQRTGSFRNWLRTITVNCLRDFHKKQRNRKLRTGDSDVRAMLEQWSDPDSSLSRQWDLEHDRHIFERLLEAVRDEFKESTWKAFYRVAVKDELPQEVADELEVTKNAVLIAKSRVLARIRQLGEGLID